MAKTLDLKDKVFHFWIDHLEIYWTFKNENIFKKLDFDNSNYSEMWNFTYLKTKVPRYLYKIIFFKDNYSMFAYYKWDNKQTIPTKDYIVIYSTAFRLNENILLFLESNLELLHCRRFDICLDIKYEINSLLKYFIDNSTWRDYKNSWNIETRYYWQVRNTKNKRYIIRVYNKILDIIEKRKHKLYWDYLLEKYITRVELEIRPELAKKVNYRELLTDKSILIWIYKNYLCKITDIFKQIKWENITLFNNQYKKLSIEDYQSSYYKHFKRNIFKWHSKTIYELWYCPIRILILEWLIQKETINLLWENIIENIENLEFNVKHKAETDFYNRNSLYLNNK